jgi:hypothetical protein
MVLKAEDILYTPQIRYEYTKPIMFSGGIGSIDESAVSKMPPKKGK